MLYKYSYLFTYLLDESFMLGCWIRVCNASLHCCGKNIGCVVVAGQLDVKEARKMIESHPQWDFQDDEDEEEKKDDDADSESNISSDDEMSDDY